MQDFKIAMSEKMTICQNVIELFTAQQLEMLRKNTGKERFRRNNIPVARLFFEDHESSFLLTELSEEVPVAFGLYEYNKIVCVGLSKLDDSRKEMGIGTIELDRLANIAEFNHDRLCVDPDFVGKYPLAVYAKVADEYGAIAEYHDGEVIKGLFGKYAKGRNADTSQYLGNARRGGFSRKYGWSPIQF